jgi:hypothetical protein
MRNRTHPKSLRGLMVRMFSRVRQPRGPALLLAFMSFAVVIGPIVLLSCLLAMLAYALTHAKEFQRKFSPPGIIDPLRDIMYGLIYPAVLGTGLVLLVLHLTRGSSPASWLQDPAVYPAIAAGFFYTFSFTALSETEEDKTRLCYQWFAFFVDWAEVALMFGCFYFLGLMDEKMPGPRLVPVYILLFADVLLVQPVWRLVAGVNVYTFFKARLIVGALLIVGILSGAHPQFHPCLDILIASAVVIFVVLYIRRSAEFQMRRI